MSNQWEEDEEYHLGLDQPRLNLCGWAPWHGVAAEERELMTPSVTAHSPFSGVHLQQALNNFYVYVSMFMNVYGRMERPTAQFFLKSTTVLGLRLDLFVLEKAPLFCISPSFPFQLSTCLSKLKIPFPLIIQSNSGLSQLLSHTCPITPITTTGDP